jgi:hypothetical protein
MWLDHDRIAVYLTRHHKKKEYLVQKFAILNLHLDEAVGVTSRGMTRIIPRKYSISRSLEGGWNRRQQHMISVFGIETA